MKNHHCISLLILLLFSVIVFSACTKQGGKLEPTTEIYQPTRSVATVPVPTKSSPACTNIMVFVDDVNYTDGTIVKPGEKFLKEWEILNYSDCNWDSHYHLFFISGDQMGAPDFIDIPHIPIGAKGKISVELTAPEEEGEYRSEWKLFGADNRFFGESLVANIVVQN